MAVRSSSPTPSESSGTTQSTDSLFRVTVSFPVRKVCDECLDFEAFSVYPLEDTLGDVLAMIAKRLGIEKDEFIFKGRKKKSCHELDPDTPFAKVFYSSAIISRIEAGAPLKPLHIELHDNPEYKGKTGMLRWILSQQPVACYGVYCEDEDPDGMLASRFAQSIAAYKIEHNVSPVPLVSEDDENED